MGNQPSLGHSAKRASRPKRAALRHVCVDYGRAHIGAQAVMLHPNNPAHSVEEFFSHDGNPSRINTIRAKANCLGHRQKGRFSVGKTEEFIHKMPHIPSNPGRLLSKNRKLSGHIGGESVIKKQVVLLFGKNSTCHIFSS